MNNGIEENPKIDSLPDGFELVDVEDLDVVEFSGQVFDLTVEEDETYTANNFIVHNSTHPWCFCQLSVISEGFDFVKRRTASQNFGRFKTGQIISDDDYRSLNDEERKKTRWDAILEFTGETASPTTEKSMIFESDEDCECSY